MGSKPRFATSTDSHGFVRKQNGNKTECRFHLQPPLERPAWCRPPDFETKKGSFQGFASSTDSHGLTWKQNGNRMETSFHLTVPLKRPALRIGPIFSKVFGVKLEVRLTYGKARIDMETERKQNGNAITYSVHFEPQSEIVCCTMVKYFDDSLPPSVQTYAGSCGCVRTLEQHYSDSCRFTTLCREFSQLERLHYPRRRHVLHLQNTLYPPRSILLSSIASCSLTRSTLMLSLPVTTTIHSNKECEHASLKLLAPPFQVQLFMVQGIPAMVMYVPRNLEHFASNIRNV
jgi:hypothetical protein